MYINYMRKNPRMKKAFGYKLIVCMVCLAFVKSFFTINVYAASITVVSTPATLSELNLNGAVLRVNLSGDSFISGIGVSNFRLNGKPPGTNISSVTRVASNKVDLYISFTGDFDTNITNFSITALVSGLNNSTVDLLSSDITIQAIDEQITAAFPPSLREDTLNGAIVDVNLLNDTFTAGLSTSDFTFAGGISGLSVGAVQRLSDTQARLTLSFSKGDIDTDKTNFGIRLNGSGLVRSTGNEDSNTTTITAIVEQVTAQPSPNPLIEESLGSSYVTLTLSGDTYAANPGISDFDLKNSITGLSISGVQRLNDTQVRITFSQGKGDIDSDKTNFLITTNGSALARSSGNIDSNVMTIAATIEDLSVSFTPSPLIEDKLEGGVITLTLIGDTFINNLSCIGFELRNNLSGLRIARLERASSTKVNVFLTYDGADFDSDKTNLVMRVYSDQFTRSSSDIDTAPITIKANDETSPSVAVSSNPSQLYENTLDGSLVRLTIRQNTFKSPSSAFYFKLNNAPTGTFIQKATFINNNVVEIELSYTGGDIEDDITNFSITILSSGLSASMELTSPPITVYAIEDIEGEGSYTSTGESYPTDIRFAGYNAAKKEIYINSTLYTTKSVGSGQSVKFDYVIDIFNNGGRRIGGKGAVSSPLSITGSDRAYIKNEKIPLNEDITSEYRIVITVARTTLQ